MLFVKHYLKITRTSTSTTHGFVIWGFPNICSEEVHLNLKHAWKVRRKVLFLAFVQTHTHFLGTTLDQVQMYPIGAEKSDPWIHRFNKVSFASLTTQKVLLSTKGVGRSWYLVWVKLNSTMVAVRKLVALCSTWSPFPFSSQSPVSTSSVVSSPVYCCVVKWHAPAVTCWLLRSWEFRLLILLPHPLFPLSQSRGGNLILIWWMT